MPRVLAHDDGMTNTLTVIPGVTLNGRPLGFASEAPVAGSVWDEPHCFACGRHTDHRGEHWDTDTLGLTTPGRTGDPYLTPLGRLVRRWVESGRMEYVYEDYAIVGWRRV